MGVFWKRYPGEDIFKESGKWSSSSFSDLEGEEEASFIITHERKVFLFEENSKSNTFKIAPREEQLNSISKEEYLKMIQKGIEFCSDENKKVVLSRTKSISNISYNKELLFQKLCKKHPNAFVYLVSSEEFGTWIGATPEILISGSEKQYQTMALAGTLPNDDSQWSKKEIQEQAIVADYLENELSNLNLTYSKLPLETVTNGPVKHLRNKFEIKSSNFNLSSFIEKVHPTPAIAGTPKSQALAAITEFELHNRSLYTGLIGRKRKDSCKVFVNLRCAKLYSNSIVAYVGGGITKDSTPEKEWEETELKAQTILSLI